MLYDLLISEAITEDDDEQVLCAHYHVDWFFSVHEALEVGNNLARVVVGDVRGPACTDT